MTTRTLIPDLLPNTQYAIQMRAVGGDGVSEWSRRLTFLTISDTINPVVPTGTSWTTVGDTFHGEWNAVTTNEGGDPIAVNRYEIELVADGVTKIDSVVPSTGSTKVTYDLTFQMNRALFGTAQPVITFRVRVVDNKELKSDWTSVLQATNAVPAAPTAPAVGSVATPGADSIMLAWTPPADDDIVRYHVYVGASAGFTPTSGNLIYAGDANRFAFTTTTYIPQYFKIRAVDRFEQESSDLTANAVAVSPFVVDTTAPSIPTGLSAPITVKPSGGGAVATVAWTMSSPPSDLAGFVFQYRPVGGGTWTQVTTDKDARSHLVDLDDPYVDYEFQIRAMDWAANYSAFSSTVTSTSPTNVAPSTPSAPSATANTLQIQVTHAHTKAAGGAMEADVVAYEVYASTTTDFTPSSSNMLGTMPVGPVLGAGFNIPAAGGSSTETWYVKVVAVDRGGLKSAASAQATATVGLIGATNIIDASITNAKIIDLTANKITAGTGFINDITVKSKFTLGDASTTGSIESYGYVAAATGFHLDKTTLEINQGSIAAAALKLQIGQNIVLPQYADFEWLESYYSAAITSTGAGLIRAVNTNAKFNSQSYATLWGVNVANTILYIGSGVTDYNIKVEPSTDYIFSIYAWCAGLVSTNFQFKVKWSDGTISTIATSNLSASMTPTTAQRLSAVMTSPAGATGAVVFIESSTFTADAGYNFDGLQVEKKLGNLAIPSSWNPPSVTKIDGGMIRTGSVQSTGIGQVWDDTLNNGIGGYKTDPDTQPAWSINLTGDAVFHALSVRGNLVVGTEADATLVDTTKLSTMASATYVPGDTGWILRADGISEFKSVRAGSLSGAAITTGTLSADAISAGTIQSDIALSGSFETTSHSTDMTFTTTSSSTTITSDSADPIFESSDVGVSVTAVGIPSAAKIVSITNDNSVVISAAATQSATVPGIIHRGRKVRISGERGITLFDQYGNELVSMPTDPVEPNRFEGSVIATDLYVGDEFRMFGLSNSLGQAAVLNLEAGQYEPATSPNGSFGWESIRLHDDGETYNISTDPYQNLNKGFFYDPVNEHYYWTNTFFGCYINNAWAEGNGDFIAEGQTDWPITIHPALIHGSNDNLLGGITINYTNDIWYFLTRNAVDVSWWMQGITRAGMDRSGGPIAGDRASAQPWADANSEGGINGYPACDSFGNNMYIAKINTSNKIVVYKYTGNNVNTTAVKSTITGSVASGHIMSVRAGTFDFGTGSTYVIVTVAGTVSGHRTNYVFLEGATEFSTTSFPFPTPYDKTNVLGTIWMGTSNADSNGHFKTLTHDGYIYDFTQLAHNTSMSQIKVSHKWRNDGTGGGTVAIGPEGPIATYTSKRRSKLTLTSTQPIPNTGGNSPNALTFYIGKDSGTRYRYDEQAAGVLQQVVTALRTSNASGTSTAMVAGVPSKIISAAGLEINGNGLVKTNNPIIKLGNSVAQTIASSTWTKLSLGILTSRGNITGSSSSALIDEAGWYWVSGQNDWVANASGRRLLRIERYTTEALDAGETFAWSETNGATAVTTTQATSGAVYCDVGDLIRLNAYQNSGGNLDTGINARLTVAMIP